jgi:hypothetical protein
VTKAGRISFLLSQATTASCAIGTGLRYLRWRQSSRADAAVESRIFLGACIFFVLFFLGNFVQRVYRKKRDYFAEEMARRRSLVRGSHS